MIRRKLEVFVGIAFGIAISIAFYFFLEFKEQRSLGGELQYNSKTGTKIDTIQAGNYKIEIKQRDEVQIKEQNEIIQEKFKSLNDRIGDLYLSITIIITLVIIIVGSVYFKTEEEVTKHMNKHFGHYKNDIEAMNGEAQKYLNEIRTKLDLAEQISLKQELNKSSQPGEESNQQIEPTQENNQSIPS